MTRQELYDIVWSAPMSAVAKQLGISDKSVVARCKRYAVPSPPRGHWTKAASSAASLRLPLEGDPAGEVVLVADRSTVQGAAAPAVRAHVGTTEQSAELRQAATSAAEGRPKAVRPLDLQLVRALAGDLQQHDAAITLLNCVAKQAIALPAHKSVAILGWVSTMRAELEDVHPVASLVRLLATNA